MNARFTSKADIHATQTDVRQVPKADIAPRFTPNSGIQREPIRNLKLVRRSSWYYWTSTGCVGGSSGRGRVDFLFCECFELASVERLFSCPLHRSYTEMCASRPFGQRVVNARGDALLLRSSSNLSARCMSEGRKCGDRNDVDEALRSSSCVAGGSAVASLSH